MTVVPPNRPFVLVNETLWQHYHARRQEIDREWQSAAAWSDIEVLGAAFTAIRAQRAELKTQVAALAAKMAGTYLVPV